MNEYVNDTLRDNLLYLKRRILALVSNSRLHRKSRQNLKCFFIIKLWLRDLVLMLYKIVEVNLNIIESKKNNYLIFFSFISF